jgi:hypothetical protein
MKNKYDYKIGLQKTLKNLLVVLAPAILGYLGSLEANVPQEYAGLIGIAVSAFAYFAKNYLENRNL